MEERLLADDGLRRRSLGTAIAELMIRVPVTLARNVPFAVVEGRRNGVTAGLRWCGDERRRPASTRRSLP